MNFFLATGIRWSLCGLFIKLVHSWTVWSIQKRFFAFSNNVIRNTLSWRTPITRLRYNNIRLQWTAGRSPLWRIPRRWSIHSRILGHPQWIGHSSAKEVFAFLHRYAAMSLTVTAGMTQFLTTAMSQIKTTGTYYYLMTSGIFVYSMFCVKFSSIELIRYGSRSVGRTQGACIKGSAQRLRTYRSITHSLYLL